MDARTLQSLSRAVLADPADPAARLVLADAYADADDDARSAWVRRCADRLGSEDGYQWDHVRSWRDGDYRCEMFDTNRRSADGKETVAYELWHHGVLIFWGADLRPGHGTAVDSDACLAALLSFLGLRPGDTDPEYFATYSAEQLDWSREWGEELGMIASDIEGRGARPVITVDGGIARKYGTDEHGGHWEEIEVDALAEQESITCARCGREELEWGWLLLDGGEEFCVDCVEVIDPEVNQ